MWLVLESKKVAKQLDKCPKEIIKQYEAWRKVVELAGPRPGETLKVVNSPWAFSSAAVGPRSGPALTGADTRMVLGELGYSPLEIERLIKDGIASESTP